MASDLDLQDAKIALDEAQLRQAVAAGQQERALEALGGIVQARERKVEQVRELLAVGKVSEIQLHDATLALREAELRQAVVAGHLPQAGEILDAIVQMQQQQVASTTQRAQVGKANPGDVLAASQVLQEARFRRAILHSQSQEALDILDGIVRIQEQQVESAKERVRVGKATQDELAAASGRLGDWRTLRERLALVVSAKQQLDEAVSRTAPDGSQNVVESARADLATARQRALVSAAVLMPAASELFVATVSDNSTVRSTTRPAGSQPSPNDKIATASYPAAARIPMTRSLVRPAEAIALDLKETVLKILAVYRKAAEEKARLRNLHVVSAMREYVRIENLGDWAETPMQMGVWGWYEAPGRDGRIRLDLDPEVLPWTAGARPYCETRYLVTHDGQTSTKFDWLYGDGTYQARAVEQRKEPFNEERYRWQRTVNGLDLLPTGLEGEYSSMDVNDPRIGDRDLQDLWVMIDKHPDWVQVRQVVEQGQPLIELTATSQVVRGFVMMVLLDSARSYAVQSIVVTMRGHVQRSFEVAQWRQISENLWLPTAWTRQYLNQQHRYQTTRVEFFDARQADAVFQARDVKPGVAMLTLPHGPGELGKPADPKTAGESKSLAVTQPPPPLGPLTAWVPGDGELFLDLDTGRTAVPPEGLAAAPDERKAWLVREGIDAVWQPDIRGDRIVLVDAALQLVNKDQWSTSGASTIWRDMTPQMSSGPFMAVQCGKDSLPVVFFVKTREGGIGKVQVTRAKDPAAEVGVQVQYMMLERPAAIDLAGLSLQQRTASLARLRAAEQSVAARMAGLQAQTDAADPRIEQLQTQLRVIRQRMRAIEQAEQAESAPASQPAAAE